MNMNKLCGVLFTAILMCSMSAFAQKPLHLDSVKCVSITEGEIVVEDFNLYKYDSLNRYIGYGDHGYTVTYDDNGRIVKTRLEQKNSGHNMLKDVTVNGVQVPDTTTVLFTEECIEYDERGNVVLEYKNTNYKYGTTYRNEFTYDKENRRTSYIRCNYSSSGKIVNMRKYTYLYDKKGILTARKEYEYEGTRFWQGNRIVETEPRWKEIAHDLCDKDGNIVLHSNYDNNDTIRYTYADGNRMVSKELYRKGKRYDRVEYSYDQHGNVISADVFDFYYNNMQQEVPHMQHEASHIINYNLNVKAADTGGVRQELHLRKSFLLPFIHNEIDYKPKMVNIPLRVSSYDYDSECEKNAYLFYSSE